MFLYMISGCFLPLQFLCNQSCCSDFYYWFLCTVKICPTTYSAAMEPTASCVHPPRDCAAGCALVLKCVWMKLRRHFFCAISGTIFPLPLFFKGVGSRRVTMLGDCFIFEFLRIIATNLHSNICILHHAT